MVLDDKLIKNMYSFLYSLIVGSAIVVLMTSGQTDSTSVVAFRTAYMVLLCIFIFIEFFSLYCKLSYIDMLLFIIFTTRYFQYYLRI